MRIAWLTPLAPDSAVGDFSRHVTVALAAHADVELWTADPDPQGPPGVAVRHFERAAQLDGALEGHDVIVHNVGNHLGFHGEILVAARAHPGVVLLHDRVLHHVLAAAWQREPTRFAARYAASMSAHHGGEGARVAREMLAGRRPPPWEDGAEVARFPLVLEALARARGVIVHSEGHAAGLRARLPVPVASLPFPCYADLVAPRAPALPPPRPTAACA